MTQPTKADLAAAVAKLTEENAALRDLLGAVQVMAAAPKPATYSDRYYWACTDRLGAIAVWAELDESAAGPHAARVISGWAQRVREKAAEPVRYEVHAEPAPVTDGEPWTRAGVAAAIEPAPSVPNPPYHMTPGTIGPCCLAEDGGYICNSQKGHDGPQHVAYGSEGQECHRWPVVTAPSGMQDPAPVARVITDSERTCPESNPGTGAWCHRDGDHGVHRDTDGEEWRTDGPFPCCEHCTPQCSAMGIDRSGHGKPCTTPGCTSTAPVTVTA